MKLICLVTSFFWIIAYSSNVFAADSATVGSSIPKSINQSINLTIPVSPLPPRGTATANPYDNLPICPSTPNITAAANCPDVNGKLQNPSLPMNCPASCRVTRALYGYSIAAYYWHWMTAESLPYTYWSGSPTPDTYISDIWQAVCPAGYVATHTYNMQLEVVWANQKIVGPTSPSDTTPKITKQQYDTLTNAGYDCTNLTNAAEGSWLLDKECDSEPWYATCAEESSSCYFGCYAPNSGAALAGVNWVSPVPNKPISNISGINGLMAVIMRKQKYAVCKVAGYCNGAADNPGTCCTSGSQGGVHWWNALYYYSFIYCVHAPGYVFTSNYVPVSVVCVHPQQVWAAPP